MRRFLPFLLVLANCALAQSAKPETHFSEPGCSTIFQRSSFAHGYRHGYEEGYHHGNLDANMSRQMRAKKSQFPKLHLGYEKEFGPRKSFESGFWSGLTAGYGDGYAGRTFRAVEGLRALSVSLKEGPSAGDLQNAHFDNGFSLGYAEGLRRSQLARPVAFSDAEFGDCSLYNPAKQDTHAQEIFCQGFQLGYVLGQGDGLLARPASSALEARK
jgi:hypothetical protein